MKISYYPGCTLKTKAKDLDRYARASAGVLGVEMEEIENWQCCGGVYNTARDEIATKLSAIRALAYAKENGGKLLTLCSACHNVLKRVSDEPYVCGFELHDIHDIANLEKKIPLDWIDAEHYRLREPFFAYARPLIAEEVKPEYQKGLPRHLKLKR